MIAEPLVPITPDNIEVGQLVIYPGCNTGASPNYVDPDTVYEVAEIGEDVLKIVAKGVKGTTFRIGGMNRYYKLYVAPEWLVNPKPPETFEERLIHELRLMSKRMDKLEYTVHQLIPAKSI